MNDYSLGYTLNSQTDLLTVHSAQPLFMMETARKGMTPIPTRKSLMAKLIMRIDVTQWNVFVAATVNITRMLPMKSRGMNLTMHKFNKHKGSFLWIHYHCLCRLFQNPYYLKYIDNNFGLFKLNVLKYLSMWLWRRHSIEYTRNQEINNQFPSSWWQVVQFITCHGSNTHQHHQHLQNEFGPRTEVHT